MRTVQEIEAALDRLPPEQLREVGDWIAARLMPETTPTMLTALDEGFRSLENISTLNRPIKKPDWAAFGGIGGKATGAPKTRSAEHYARISALGVAARKAKSDLNTSGLALD